MLEISMLKPRERLRFYGASQLSTQELMMILLRQGTVHHDLPSIAEACLTYYQHLTSVTDTTLEELMEIEGIGEAKACELIAAVELGRRLLAKETHIYGHVVSSCDFGEYLVTSMGSEVQEQLQIYCLNIRNQIVSKKTIFIGGVSEAMSHPREIYHEAVRHLATSIVMVHNHPSDHIQPSARDLEITKRIQDVGELMGIPLLDHFIVSPHHYFSFKEHDLL